MKYSSLEVDIPTKGIARENEDRNIDRDETNQMEKLTSFHSRCELFCWRVLLSPISSLRNMTPLCPNEKHGFKDSFCTS